MKTFLRVFVVTACAVGVRGTLEPMARAEVQQSPAGSDRLSPEDLEELLAPIALYPDPLLANVLTAAVYPDQLTAAKAVAGDAAKIDASDWEPSVKAVAKIPDAMTMLTEYPEWTAAIGEAFILQSQDVMAAVQRLRTRAQDSGALQTTPQQVVQEQGDTIIIQPADPEVIYVPDYDPDVVYVDHYDDGDVVAAGVIGFGLGVATGAIIANNIDCDWYGGGCCHGCGWGWHGGYHGGDYNGGHNNKVNIDTGGGDINIGGGNENTIGGGDRGDRNRVNNRPAGAGSKWKPNQDRMSQSLRNGQGQNMGKYKGAGRGGVSNNARVPNRKAGAQPISSRPAPKAGAGNRAGAGAGGGRGGQGATRPSAQPTNRPSGMQSKGSGPKAGKPSIPPSSKRPPAASGTNRGGGGKSASRPSTPSSKRPGGYSGGGGGSQKKAASRGSSSRSSAGGSRGGGRSSGGARGGGGRGGGGRGGGGRR